MLAHATGLPLLGTVTLNQTQRERRRDNWRLAGFAACCLALVTAFAGVAMAPELLELL